MHKSSELTQSDYTCASQTGRGVAGPGKMRQAPEDRAGDFCGQAALPCCCDRELRGQIGVQLEGMGLSISISPSSSAASLAARSFSVSSVSSTSSRKLSSQNLNQIVQPFNIHDVICKSLNGLHMRQP